ncbi:MAG: GNAT family N-acetyltransferase [Desulfuromonadales bacterium]
MDIKLREAHEEDLPALLALYGQLGQDDGSVLSLEEAQLIFARFRSYPYYRLHVAELDEILVGTFALLIMDNLGHLGTPTAILEDVVVDETLRGKGIGKRMMEYANDLCRHAGCYKMTFSSNMNRETAHRFYESLGFRRHGYSFYIDYE